MLGGFRGEDERADLCAPSAEDYCIRDVRGRTEGELDRDGVGLFAIDLLRFELGIEEEGDERDASIP